MRTAGLWSWFRTTATEFSSTMPIALSPRIEAGPGMSLLNAGIPSQTASWTVNARASESLHVRSTSILSKASPAGMAP